MSCNHDKIIVRNIVTILIDWFMYFYHSLVFYGKLISHEKKCGCKQQHEDCWDKKMNRP